MEFLSYNYQCDLAFDQIVQLRRYKIWSWVWSGNNLKSWLTSLPKDILLEMKRLSSSFIRSCKWDDVIKTKYLEISSSTWISTILNVSNESNFKRIQMTSNGNRRSSKEWKWLCKVHRVIHQQFDERCCQQLWFKSNYLLCLLLSRIRPSWAYSNWENKDGNNSALPLLEKWRSLDRYQRRVERSLDQSNFWWCSLDEHLHRRSRRASGKRSVQSNSLSTRNHWKRAGELRLILLSNQT